MHSDLVDVGWNETQWSRIRQAVTEEAARSRVAAQMLPVTGPEEPKTIAVPNFTLRAPLNPAPPPAARFSVDSQPSLPLTTIAVHVPLRTFDVADPDLSAAFVMFRRAANDVARIEDALVFGGRPAPNTPPPLGIAGIDPVYTVTGDGAVAGVFWPVPGTLDRRDYSQALLPIPFVANGGQVIDRVVAAILALERNGQNGPFACVLSHELYAAICLPSPNLVLPRDRILPFLQGPLLRSSTIAPRWGAVIALNANSIEIVVARDMHVRFLQTTLDPRVVFRVSERVGLRIKDDRAIALVRA